VLYTGMQGQCGPRPKGPPGKPALHYTNGSRACAKWADAGALQQAFIASVGHLSEEQRLDGRILHGDGTNPVATQGAMASGTLAPSINGARRASPSLTTMAMC
jgi:hypothetical protein